MDIVPKIQSCCLVLSLILTGIRENTGHGDCLYFLTDPIERGHASLNILLVGAFYRQRKLSRNHTVGYLTLKFDTHNALYKVRLCRLCSRRCRLRTDTNVAA